MKTLYKILAAVCLLHAVVTDGIAQDTVYFSNKVQISCAVVKLHLMKMANPPNAYTVLPANQYKPGYIKCKTGKKTRYFDETDIDSVSMGGTKTIVTSTPYLRLDTIYQHNGYTLLCRVVKVKLTPATPAMRQTKVIPPYSYKPGSLVYKKRYTESIDQTLVDSVHYADGQVLYTCTPYLKKDTAYYMGKIAGTGYVMKFKMPPLKTTANNGNKKYTWYKPGVIWVWLRPRSKHSIQIYGEDDIDSIRTANGATYVSRWSQLNHPLPLNRFFADNAYSMLYLGYSIEYERKIKSGAVGFTFPLHTSFSGVLAPAGTISLIPHGGTIFYSPGVTDSRDTSTASGYNIAAGFGVKYYWHRGKMFEAYSGIEFTAGYQFARVQQNTYDTSHNLQSISYASYHYYSATALYKMGVDFYRTQGLTLGFDGGLGLGAVYGNKYAYGLTLVMFAGVKIGLNWYGRVRLPAQIKN